MVATEAVTVIVSSDLERLAWALEQQGNLILRLRQLARRRPSHIIELAIIDARAVYAVIEEAIKDSIIVESHAE